jgi:hypothetical protein
MAVDFQGQWRGTVVGRTADFGEHVLVTGAASGNGAYNGVVGNSFEFTGGQVDLQWNDEAGSGCQPSALITSTGMSSPLVTMRFISADDNYPDQRDGDFDDLQVSFLPCGARGPGNIQAAQIIGGLPVSQNATPQLDFACGPLRYQDGQFVIEPI